MSAFAFETKKPNPAPSMAECVGVLIGALIDVAFKASIILAALKYVGWL